MYVSLQNLVLGVYLNLHESYYAINLILLPPQPPVNSVFKIYVAACVLCS